MKKVMAVLVSAAMSTASIANLQAGSLKRGMTRQEVVEKMGDPDRTRTDGAFEILVFEGQGMSGFSIDRQDYSVILKGGKVEKYGAGNASISKSGNPEID